MIRKTMTVLLAISVIVLSISAAFAADGGVFGEVAAREGEYADKRLSVLDEIAEKPAASQTLEDGIAVEVNQAYYEGSRIFVSYKVGSNADLIQLNEGAPEETQWTHEVENWITGEAPAIDQADYMKEHDWLNGQGQRWLEGPYDVIEGILLEDGTETRTVGGMEIKQKDGSLIGWLEAVIPEEKATDSQSFALSVSCNHAVKFQDNANYKENWQETEKASIPFTAARNKDAVTLQGTLETDTWKAKAAATAGQADMQVIIRLTSDEQSKARNDLETGSGEVSTDLIIYWDLYKNHQPMNDVYGENRVFMDGDDIVYEITFPRMDNVSALSLVPMYARTGAHTDEAIVIETSGQ